MAHRILVCDDEADVRESLRILLVEDGFDVTAVASGANAIAEAPDHEALLLDIKMPGQDGMETLAKLRAKGVSTPVVMISGHGDIRTAMDAVRAGAADFLEKPLSSEHVLNALRRVLDASRLVRENEELKRRLGITRLVASSEAMRKLQADIRNAAPTPATVLIAGPSGTGKKLVARAIHEASLVKGGPFVQVNCAAIPDSLIESELFGHEGTLGGMGEKQIEVDRRLIARRVKALKDQLVRLKRQRLVQRRARVRGQVLSVSLVGYTNAGKSTLFSALTNSHVSTEDMQFATLDPTVSQMPNIPTGNVLLLDTVGFVSNLPHELIAAFRSDEEICREIGADALIYQDLEALRQAVRTLNPALTQFDTSCFDGHYITGDVSEAYLARLEGQRNGVVPVISSPPKRQMDLNLASSA